MCSMIARASHCARASNARRPPPDPLLPLPTKKLPDFFQLDLRIAAHEARITEVGNLRNVGVASVSHATDGHFWKSG